MAQSITDLTHVSSEDEITETLRQRYLRDQHYTSINCSVLVALNPFQSNANWDNIREDYVIEYKDTQSAKLNQWRESHLFQLVNHAYLHMRRTSINQAILFSGESGSGKTEQLKQTLHHLVSLSTHKKQTRVQQQILHGHTILQCFGNAKTTTHDNASRFTLHCDIHFTERGRIAGAKWMPYMLEKNRVTGAGQDERSFHVFYCMLAAPPEERARLGLSDWSAFQYLAHTNTGRASTMDDAQNYHDLRSALRTLLFPKHMIAQIFQVLAAILHLGNLVFIEDPNNSQDAAIVKNVDDLAMAADLLGVDPHALMSTLSYKSKLIKRDITTLFLDPQQAAQQRDDMAQTLYALLFTWIVEHMNERLTKEAHSTIALVDVPGFSRQLGGFDQLAFHYMNEVTHQFMLSSIFERDLHEYAEQGIAVPTGPWPNNAACIDLFVHPAKGMFGILNAQVTRQGPRPTDASLIQQYESANRSNDGQLLSFRSGADATTARAFAIQHFWGSVTYDPNGFMDRNEDYISSDFVSLFTGNAYSAPTTNGLVAQMFSEQLIGADGQRHNRVSSPQQGIRPLRSTLPTKSGQNGGVPTVGEQLLVGVTELTSMLANTIPWFVLCVRPNDMSLPNSCDAKKIAHQVRQFKLWPLSRRLALHYTTIFTMEEFFDRYTATLNLTLGKPLPNLPLQERCEWVAGAFNWDATYMAIGRDKVYLSTLAFRILEDELRSLEKSESKRSKMSPTGHLPRKHRSGAFDMYSFHDDQMSSALSDDEYLDSQEYGSDLLSQSQGQSTHDEKKMELGDPALLPSEVIEEEKEQLSSVRRKWVALVWLLTWWMPSPCLNYCGGMKRKDIRLAWREKVALCFLIFLLSAAMVVFIVFFGPLICPHQDVFSFSELQSKSTKESAYVAIRGEVFDLTKFAPHHWASEVIPDSAIFDYAGKDATNLFPVQVSALCDGTTGRVPDELVLDFQVNLTDRNAAYHDFRYFTNDYRPDWYFEQMVYMRKNYRLGFMGYEPSDILRQATNTVPLGEINTHRQWAILHGDIYDLTYYLMGGRAPRVPEGQVAPTNLDLNFMDNSIVELFRQLAGTDISKHFDALPIDQGLRMRQLVCLRNLFFVGKVDTRRSLQCQFSEYFLLIITGFLCAVILFKFLAALQLGSYREPEDYDKFIVCQVPCYTESEESLRKTIDSIAVLRYDDKRKLLFLVCDGMIVGSGNDRPTPRIVLDILGVDANVDPEPLSFLSLGEGRRQHNMGKIYSGLYECSGHVVPYVVVVKVGANERQKPGNRGKRDSQMVLMQFLNKVHFESPMTPMELEIYHQIKNVIGVNPSFYEFVLMIDADTEVLPDSLNRMVSCFVHDSKIVGLCGETKLANEKDSWVTMIQVYEYYISHFLAKAFESLFGSVTCLPGCFCMYRVRSPQKHQPLLVSNQVINDYAENRVHTLHQKNLLHLGEDRYLTTLILKHFPTYKTKFTADACCLTNAPETWSVLLSQRRRWINSTIHNLGELVFLPQLCGFCCFSMRFVVILDLLSTLAMPAVVCYLGYLIYRLVSDAGQVPMISIITLCGVYGLQAIIFIIRRKWEHIGWMIVYILAIPLFSFFIPIYSFWHFDDFSWGNTRLVVGEDGQKKALPVDEGHFDPKTIPLKKWNDHESELWETGSIETKGTSVTATSRRTYQPYAASVGLYNDSAASFRMSQQHLHQHLMRPGSVMMPSGASVYSESAYAEMMPPPPPPPPGAAAVMMGGPRDEDIRREVQRITATADLMTMTKKQVREQLSRHFGMDMSYRKDFINYCIEEALHL
ncbi:chitin synthase-domain-containing protein [Radiomyces spectabilis]|uniref:chitin synthase-domain-containing protein n=1 Tax=Radiomyces spectabilis TaxID=64574 RepID=UPI00221FDC5F|nr:chitin synthase-domain-containing protein [Radiomyces spectabilis]KAI8376017.1 chitin synthase-domain-containing protein [Radiomyces spectabilis]